MAYSDEFLKRVTSVGTLGYNLEKSINVLEPENEKQFIADFDNKNSEVYKSYQKGVDKSDYMIDLKLFKMATEGDLKALQKYEERKSYQKVGSRKG
jgi:hypothetical protein